MDKEDPVERLLADLKRSDEAIRDRATAALWHGWFHQKGVRGAQQLMEAQSLLDAGRIGPAETLLTSMLEVQPDFVEAWNRRAVLHFTQRNYWKAIADCQKAIELAPHHFGALHGLGLSHRAVGHYTAAIQAFRQALGVQPYALVNQRLILECTTQLPS